MKLKVKLDERVKGIQVPRTGWAAFEDLLWSGTPALQSLIYFKLEWYVFQPISSMAHLWIIRNISFIQCLKANSHFVYIFKEISWYPRVCVSNRYVRLGVWSEKASNFSLLFRRNYARSLPQNDSRK